MVLLYYQIMKKTWFKKCISLPHIVRGMKFRNKLELNTSSLREIRRIKRLDLLERFPDTPDGELESKLDRIMARGSRPTKAKVPEAPGMPSAGLAARRSERDKRARKRRSGPKTFDR